MGHSIVYESFKKDTPKNVILTWAAREGSRGDSSHSGRISFHEDIICESWDGAIEKIESLDRGWYDDHAVLYKEYQGKSKAMIANRDKARETREKREKYIKDNGVHKRAADTITCPKCKSRLNLGYLSGNHCPLCHTDLRSNTVITRIKTFDDKLKELDKKYAELEKKQKYEVKWCVKCEYHE